MRVAFASEMATDVSEAVKVHLAALGHEVIALDGPGLGWADLGLAVGNSVAAGRADRGVAFCGNGVGVTMAANKVGGVRAALCATPHTASAARQFNDANVLTLGLEVVSPETAVRILQAFLAAEWDGSEADQIQALGRRVSDLPVSGGKLVAMNTVGRTALFILAELAARGPAPRPSLHRAARLVGQDRVFCLVRHTAGAPVGSCAERSPRRASPATGLTEGSSCP